MLLGETTPLYNREMHLDWKKDTPQSAKTASESANFALDLPPKCKNCTLEENAVLHIIQSYIINIYQAIKIPEIKDFPVESFF